MFSLFFTQLVQDVTHLDKWVRPLYESPYYDIPVNTPNCVYIQVSESLLTIPRAAEILVDNDSPDAFYERRNTQTNIFYEDDPLEARTFNKQTVFALGNFLEEESTPVPLESINLEILVPQGLYYFTPSTDIEMLEDVSIEQEEILLTDFKIRLALPFTIGSTIRTYKYFNSDTLIEEIDRGVDFMQFYTPRVIERDVYRPIYINNRSINSSHTMSTTSHVDTLLYDDLNDPSIYVAVLNYIPKGVLYTVYKEPDEQNVDKVVSKSYLGGEKRGYFPSTVLGVNMQNTTLLDIAWGVLGLIASNQDSLLRLTIKELVYFNDRTKETYGLPSTLPRNPETSNSCILDTERNVYDNAFLGIALITACNYLNNRKVPYNSTPPKDLDKLLREIANLVVVSIDINYGLCVEAFSKSGFAIGDYLFSTSALCCIYLNMYLSIEYKESIHSMCVRLENRISDHTVLDRNELTPRYCCSMILWNLYYSKDESIWLSRLLNSYNDLLSYHDKSLGIYLLNRYFKDRLIAQWEFSYSFTEYTPQLYGDSSPALIPSAAKILITDNYPLFQQAVFNTYAEAGVNYNALLHEEIKRMTPELYSVDMSSSYGCLLKAVVDTYDDWYVYFCLLKDSLSALKSQGEYLDKWLAVYGLKRRYLESDSICRLRLLNKIILFSNNKNRLLVYLNKTYEKFEYKDTFNYPIILDIDDLSTVVTNYDYDFLSSIISTNEPMGVYALIEYGSTFVPIDKIAGTVTIDMYEYMPELIKEVKDALPMGIKLNSNLIFADVTYLDERDIVSYE